jgi:hypothetical protein
MELEHCREGSIVGHTLPMTIPDLGQKLDPARCPDMSPQMGAIVGFLFDRAYTPPALAELTVTPDGHLVGRPQVEGDIGHTTEMGCEADMRAGRRTHPWLTLSDGLTSAQCSRSLGGRRLGCLYGLSARCLLEAKPGEETLHQFASCRTYFPPW